MTAVSRIWPSLASCSTPADYYREQIRIQQFATPVEVAALAASRSTWPAEFDFWLRRTITAMSTANTELQPFKARPLGDGVLLYSKGDRPRVLVMGFCGKAGLLFMPLAVTLQYFGQTNCNFLVLRDDSKQGFVAGISGYAESFSTLVARVRSEIDTSGYEDIRCFGTSGGGAAALAAGVLFGATHAACFSGHMPLTSERYAARPGAREMDSLLREAAPLTNFATVYGEENPLDGARAEEMAEALKLRRLPKAGIKDHNVLWELHKRRELLPVFREVGLI